MAQRFRRVQKQARILEQHVSQRTSELSVANQQLQQEIDLRQKVESQLIEANSRLQDQIEEITALRDSLKEQAMRDLLTGLYNRRYLEDELERELARARRSRAPVCVLMIDIDHFKTVNDTYGHRAGDVVLQTLSSLLTAHIRSGDVACRYGGEEFVVVFSGASLEHGQQRAEHIRRISDQRRIPYENAELAVTISVGVAAFPHHGSTVDELLDHADQALYQAKHNGRNCVMVYEPIAASLD